MLKSLKVIGYKSLKDLSVRLKPLSVLMGPNASGKSNLLDLLQLISRTATCRTLKEAFEPPYRGKPIESFSFEEQGIPSLLSRESASFEVEIDICLTPHVIESVEAQIAEMRKPGKSTSSTSGSSGDSKSIKETELRYRLGIEILPKSGIIRVTDEYLAALNRRGQPARNRAPFIEKVNNRIHLRMEGQAHPKYHDRYLDHTVLSLPLYAPHYPHAVAMREELTNWLFFYFEPRERMRHTSTLKEVSHIGQMGEDLAAFLNTLFWKNERQFRAIEKALSMVIPSITGLSLSTSDLGEVELRVLEGDVAIPARVVSEGTLRVLGLLALASSDHPPSLIGFEEPENGVHPRRLEHVARLLQTMASRKGPQVIATTHSPLMADLMQDDQLYWCKKSTGTGTAIQPFKTTGELYRPTEIEEALDDGAAAMPVSARILRGDFDA